MAVDFPMPGIVDIRMPIVGDSFSWAGTEPRANKKSIVIHGTASEAPNEDGFTMAEYHVNTNGWGGIGVHFVVTKDEYPGRPGQTPAGPQVQYVGDLGTWRAGCLNQNLGRIHIEISGLFTGRTPSESQLRLTRNLIDFMLAPNDILPSMSYPSQVTYHNAVPGQNTACPGWQYPHFQEWFNYLQGGAEPSWFSTQQPVPAPVVVTPPAIPEPDPIVELPTPEPTPEVPAEPTGQAPDGEIPVVITPPIGTPENPGSVLDDEPEYQVTYQPVEPYTMLTVSDGYAVDMTGAGEPKAIAANRAITVVGKFTDNGVEYVRSDKSIVLDAANGTWYGLRSSAFDTGYGVGLLDPVQEANGLLLGFAKAFASFFGTIFKIKNVPAWLLSKLTGRK